MSDNKTKSERKDIKPAMIADERTMAEIGGNLRRLFVALSSESYHPLLISPPGSETRVIDSPMVDWIAYPQYRFPLFKAQNKDILMDKLSTYKPTIFHCFSQKRAAITRQLAEAMKVPYVCSFHSFRKGFLKPYLSEVYCKRLIAASGLIRKQLSSSYSLFHDRIELIHPGIFVEDRCSCFSGTNRVPSMVIAEPLTDITCFEPLMNAVRHLTIDGYTFVLAVIGVGPASRRLHKFVTSHGLSTVVTFVGQIPSLRNIFSGADIFIQCKYSTETYSHILDAMSLGMAVASCDTCKEEYLISDETAVFFDPYDEFSIYSCLLKLLDQKPFARDIARNGQQLLREQYTVSQMAQRLIDIYKESV
jgi:glycosyltransferase involved in cell wall biosynthesis